MATKNDVTGDSIPSKSSSKAFLDNYDKIDWSKKKPNDNDTQHKEVKNGSTNQTL